MTHLVYPGALHTRFHHALGAMHLMSLAIEVLRNKDHEITDEEEEALIIAILLHDIGHGPFSHALEETIVEDISHEDISTMFMNKLNAQLGGRLIIAIDIFNDTYPRKFLHQLVASQLDMDRLDYLNRDSFFTGVSEGVISSDRIIKMLNVKDDHIVIEEKGIYSIEKFLIARRLMYWQVYLHKTVIGAELMLAKILSRAKMLALQGVPLFSTPALAHFLKHQITRNEFIKDDIHLETFAQLDDSDIMSAIKVWCNAGDPILRLLCNSLINRNLYHVDISNEMPSPAFVSALKIKAMAKYDVTEAESHYFIFTDTIRNRTYNAGDGNILILMKNSEVKDIATASDHSNLEALAKTVKKYILCCFKDLL